MGASNFLHVAEGEDPDDLFRSLSREAKRRNGSSYSGEINMKNGIRRRRQDVMPKEKALAFAREDTRNNDKWGPAFYVEYYDGAVEETLEVRTGALTEAAAEERLLRKARRKSDLSGDLFAEVKQKEIETSGSLPDLSRTRPAATDREREEEWLIRGEKTGRALRRRLSGRAYHDLTRLCREERETERQAREAIKEYFRRHPKAEVEFVVRRRWTDEIERFASRGEDPSSKPMWEGTVRIVEETTEREGDGFVFYGMASE